MPAHAHLPFNPTLTRPARPHPCSHLPLGTDPPSLPPPRAVALLSPAPPHPQDILKYTFSFLQLKQGGSQPQNRADQREAAATVGPFRLSRLPEDARFPQTHLETRPAPPKSHLCAAEDLRGAGPVWEWLLPNPVITESSEAAAWAQGGALQHRGVSSGVDEPGHTLPCWVTLGRSPSGPWFPKPTMMEGG